MAGRDGAAGVGEKAGGRRPAEVSGMVPVDGRGDRVGVAIPREPGHSGSGWEGKDSPLERVGEPGWAALGEAEDWGGVRVPAGGLR